MMQPQPPSTTSTTSTIPAAQPASGFTPPDAYNVTATFLDRSLAAGWGERTAIYFNSEQWTYAQLAEEINRVGGGLRALGVTMEERVAVLLYDSPQFAGVFFGAMKIGVVAVPINTQLRPQDYLYMLNDSRASALVVEADLWALLAPMREQFPFLRQVILVRGDGGSDVTGTMSYDALVAAGSSTLVAAPTTRDDAAFWLYSSGSTGFPKGCVHLQHDMAFCCEHYARPVLGIRPDDITFSAAKLYFAYGLGNGLYFPMGVGASAIHYPGRMTAEVAFRVISDQRPTIFFGSPTLFAAMLAMSDTASRFDTSSLRLCVSAGESLPADIFNRWRDRFGVEILDGIGSTEMLHIFISNRAGEVKPGSTGKPVPGYSALIVDEQGQPVPQGEIGNLLVAGDSACAFYWNKHQRSRTTFLGPWTQTGDKYYQDQDGYYWYCGRSDDMLKVSGQWVSPAEVEAALIAHPAVLQAAVVGYEDGEGLTKPYAFIVLKQGEQPGDAMEAALKQHVKTTLLPHKYPRWVEFVAELPMTATGKIQRYRLREILAERRQTAGG
ncbi:MAG: benzoate-CoA ligase family protein [Ktedonobacterales bacterium]